MEQNAFFRNFERDSIFEPQLEKETKRKVANLFSSNSKWTTFIGVFRIFKVPKSWSKVPEITKIPLKTNFWSLFFRK